MSDQPKKPAALDVHASVVRMGELVVRQGLEKAAGGLRLWDGGLGDLVDSAVASCGLPRQLTALDAARALGLLPAEVKPQAEENIAKRPRSKRGRR